MTKLWPTADNAEIKRIVWEGFLWVKITYSRLRFVGSSIIFLFESSPLCFRE